MSTENLETKDLLLAFFTFPSNEHGENCALSYMTRLLHWEFGDCCSSGSAVGSLHDSGCIS